jgi:anti-sigma factor RsiW
VRPFQLSGHIGAGVSALVDGQLSSEDEERAWAHILGCPGCRRLVENEGWTKTQLRTFATPAASAAPSAPSALMGALYDVEAWARVDEIERASRRRIAATALVGAGSVGFAVLGIVGMTSAPAGLGEVPSSPSQATIRSEQVGSLVGAAVGAVALTTRRTDTPANRRGTHHVGPASARSATTAQPVVVGHTAR